MRMPIGKSLTVAALTLAVGFFAPRSEASDPTAEQQYMLELLNRMRMAPAAELDKLVNLANASTWDSPRSDHLTVAAALNYYGVSASELTTQWSTLSSAPPLAWNNTLAAASSSYSNLMTSVDVQAHGLDGQSVGQRIVNAGYSSSWGDSAQTLFATASDVTHAHSALAIDWGPDGGSGTGIQPGATHRAALMDPLFKEIGVGFQTISIPLTNIEVTGPLVVTQHLANNLRSNGVSIVSDAILTGSIYNDLVLGDNFYTPGEGIGGALVFVYDNSTGQMVASGQTNSVGGFNITLTGLTDGTMYRVEAPETGQAAQNFTLNPRQENYGTVSNPNIVTLYDNVYASFVAVPEPGSAALMLISGLIVLRRRRPSLS
jgi:uncharacterized protein YkwD